MCLTTRQYGMAVPIMIPSQWSTEQAQQNVIKRCGLMYHYPMRTSPEMQNGCNNEANHLCQSHFSKLVCQTNLRDNHGFFMSSATQLWWNWVERFIHWGYRWCKMDDDVMIMKKTENKQFSYSTVYYFFDVIRYCYTPGIDHSCTELWQGSQCCTGFNVSIPTMKLICILCTPLSSITTCYTVCVLCIPRSTSPHHFIISKG